MSQKKLAAIETYLLGRIAQLELMLTASGIKKSEVPGIAGLIAEDRLTLKKVREIVK